MEDVRFLFAGAGAERDMLMCAAKARGLGNVVFMPAQPKEAMPAVWSLCDVALVHLRDLPAFAEVIPSKIFEAMAMGLPILLAAPKGEAADIVEGHAAGRWVAPEAPEELAGAVRSLAEDREGREALSAAALAAAPAHSRETQAQEMLAVLEVAKAS
jgi:glycosyltransferase involved in cell wall biosynthesis